MDVRLTRSHKNPSTIRPGVVQRDWMDETQARHAYQCLPVTLANTRGWELLLPQEVVVQWDGEASIPEVLAGGSIAYFGEDAYARDLVEQSIVGTVSFSSDWAIQTPEGYGVLVSGAPNYFVDGAVPHTALVPGWWPDPVNMNWRITKKCEPVVFPKGMPYMFFQIVRPNLLSEVDFTVLNAWDDPERMASRSEYSRVKRERSKASSWMRGLRTGLDHNGRPVGPKHEGYEPLDGVECPVI